MTTKKTKYQVLGTLKGKLVKENCVTKKDVDTTIDKLKKKRSLNNHFS